MRAKRERERERERETETETEGGREGGRERKKCTDRLIKKSNDRQNKRI